MEIKRGIPVSPGVAIGPALVVDTEGFRIPQRFIEKKQRKEEVARLREAVKAAALEARANQEAINAKLGKQYSGIFSAPALLIQHAALTQDIENLIREQDHTAEYAVS